MNPPAHDLRIIAVNEAVASAGRIIWWRLSGACDYDKLEAAWRDAGLDEELLPLMPAPSTALLRAVGEQRDARRLVRPLPKKDGWALVDEHTEGDELTWNEECRVRLDAVGRIVVEPATHPLRTELRAAYNKHLTQLANGDVGPWLTKLVTRVDGVPLRDTGGVYFIPATRVEEWSKMVGAIAAASGHAILGVPALKGDDAVRAILDAVSTEASEAAREMEQELLGGQLGERALETRVQRAEALDAKVGRYEELLGAKLESLRARLVELRSNLAVAALQESSGPAADLAGL